MNATLLELLSSNGGPALAACLLLAALGVPFVPATLLLLATGALASDLGFSLPSMMAWGLAASVTGDQAGYWIGRIASGPLRDWINARPTVAKEAARAENIMEKQGFTGIFLTRWLITPAGPYVNLAAGLLSYSWWKFTLAGVSGEAIWVGLYVYGGTLAGEGIEDIASIVGDVTWMAAAAIAVIVLARQLLKKDRQGADNSAAGA